MNQPALNSYLFKAEKIEDCRSGLSQLHSNIEVCNAVAELLSSTFGPYGMDKLFYGKSLIVTNDGATIMENMNFKHPVALMLTNISKSQDKETGDGTTSVVLLTAALLNSIYPCITDENNISVIRKTLAKLKKACIESLNDLKIECNEHNLIKLAETCMNSKNIRTSKEHFANMLVKGLMSSENLHICKIKGGSFADSILVEGIAFQKTFTYAGSEQQLKRIGNPMVCCLNMELEWKNERENAELKIESVEEYQRMVDAEWKIIRDKLKKIVNAGADVVLSSQSIGDYATQYFADNGVFSAGRVPNLVGIAKGFGIPISNTSDSLSFGRCKLFEERQMGGVRYNYLEGENVNASTLLLRGPGEDVLEEIERAVHDAECVLRVAMRTKNLISGGGSSEMHLSQVCREKIAEMEPEEIIVCKAVAQAFERLPAQLSSNFGYDPVRMLQELRKAHKSNVYAGVTVEGVRDMRELAIYEPLEVKKSMVKTAFAMVDTLLSIDSTIIERKY